MAKSSGLISTIKRHPLPAVVVVISGMLAAAGYAQQGYDFWIGGIKPWHLQAAGFFLFYFATVVMLARWDRERDDLGDRLTALSGRLDRLVADFAGQSASATAAADDRHQELRREVANAAAQAGPLQEQISRLQNEFIDVKSLKADASIAMGWVRDLEVQLTAKIEEEIQKRDR